jgi:PRTRC genetic system ThiF family protein
MMLKNTIQNLKKLLRQVVAFGARRLFKILTPVAKLARRLDLQKRYRVNIGHPDRVAILLAGCGGSGSFAAHILAQLAAWAAGAGLDLRLYFIDPDTVEEKNLVRQNFCRAEIGYPKALTLAWRYTAAFGITITPVVKRFSAEMLKEYMPALSTQGRLMIVVGAVDNVQARRDIAGAITDMLEKNKDPRNRFWWIDAGNERMSGQVVAGNSLDPEPLLSPLGFCSGLPLPHLQEPTLVRDRERPATGDLSCAELGLLEEQSAMINRMMANWIGVYLYRLLQSRDLDIMATYVALDAGVARSTPIKEGRLVVLDRQRRPPVMRPQQQLDALVQEEYPDGCPTCGGEIIEGDEDWQGVIIRVRFCARCDWRDDGGCPECGGEVMEEEVEIEDELVPAIVCADCDWRQPIQQEIPY